MYKSLLPVQCKTAVGIDFKTPLARYISDELKQDPLEFADGVSTLSDLRTGVCVKAPEAYTRGLQDLMKYHGLFASVQKRFPMTPEDRTMTFTWTDVFASGGMFSSKSKSVADANFETACVMFNLGALHAQIAKGGSATDGEGQKTAIDMLQKSATYFKELKSFVEAKFAGGIPSPDFEPGLLDALSKTMLAQAQEIMFAKALSMSPVVLAKVAKSCSELYGTATEAVGSRKELAGWSAHLRCKCDYYYSEAEYRQSLVHEAAKNWGMALSRMREAVRIGIAAGGVSNGLDFASTLSEYVVKIKGVLAKAENDMTLIYCESVPDFSSMPSVEGQKLVKDDKPLPECESVEIMGADPFEKLLPLAIKKGQDDYVTQRDELIKGFRGQLQAVIASSVEALAEMNLPAALHVITDPNTVPKDLLEKADRVRSMGGADKLLEMLSNLEGPRAGIRQKLDDAKVEIDTEEQEDNEMRAAHGTTKWSRTPSAEQNGKMRAEGFKLQGWLTAATDGDSKIRLEFDAAHSGIVVVTKPADELLKLLPSAGGAIQRTASGRDTSGVEELQALMKTLDVCRKDNDALLGAQLNLDQPDDDITQQLLAHSSGDVDRASLFAQQLAKFDGIGAQVTALVSKTNEAVAETRRANQVFVASRGDDTASNERKGMLADLDSKAEAFHTVLGNLTEGTNFYSKLSGMATSYHSKVKDFCVARKIEKQSLLADLTQAAAAAAAVPAPAPLPAVPVAAAAPPPQQQYQQPVSYGAPSAPPPMAQATNPYAPQQPAYGAPPPQQQQQQAYNPYTGAPQAQQQQQPYVPAARSGSGGPPGYVHAQHMAPVQAPTNPYAAPPTNPYGAPPPQQQQQQQYNPYGPPTGSYGLPSPPAGAAAAGGMPGVHFAQPNQQYPGAAARATSGPSTDQWSCPACSFFNSNFIPRCEMCDFARPQ